MRAPLRALLLALCAVLLWTAGASALDVPPNGGQYVVDLARLLPPQEKDAIGAELRRYEQATGNQLVVLTVPSLMGEDISGYANRVARAWGVGRKDRNNGVLILVAAAEKRVRFEVGRGVEDRLPDITAKRIQREVTLPLFKAGRFGQGLAASVEAIERTLTPADGDAQGQPQPAQPLPQRMPEGGSGIPWLTLGLIILAVVLMLSLAGRRRVSRGYYDQNGQFIQDGRGSSFLLGLILGILSNIFRGRGGGGGGFGGGGFGGGSGGGDGGFSGGGGDFGGGGSDSGWGGGGDSN